VPIISFDDALVLHALLTLCGRHGEAAWRGQHDTGRARAAFRAAGRQVAFRHRSQLGERPALLAHVFVRRHRPPTSEQKSILRRTSPSRLTIPVDRPGCERGIKSGLEVGLRGPRRLRTASSTTDRRQHCAAAGAYWEGRSGLNQRPNSCYFGSCHRQSAKHDDDQFPATCVAACRSGRSSLDSIGGDFLSFRSSFRLPKPSQ
jgi:hypothetical protein